MTDIRFSRQHIEGMNTVTNGDLSDMWGSYYLDAHTNEDRKYAVLDECVLVWFLEWIAEKGECLVD